MNILQSARRALGVHFFSNPMESRHLIEPLEQRIAPANVTWIGTGSGNWDDTSKWSNSQVPTANDDVTINVPAGSFTITVEAGSQAAHSVTMTSDDHLAINGGSLTLSVASTVSNLDVSNGTLTANAQLKLTGTSTLANNASTLTGLFRNEGTLSLTGADPNLLNATLDNAGTITDSGARLDFLGGATLNNLSGALFDVSFAGTGDFLFNAAGTGNLFHNAGTLRRSASGTATFDGVPFQNDAGAVIDVTVSGGVFQLNTSGSMAGGDFTVATGGVVDFGGGASFTLTGSYTGSGGGNVTFTNGTLTPGVGGATFNFPVGFFQWANNAATIANGTLNNAATGFIQITGADPNLDHATLNNSGTITDSGARLDFLGGATLNNLSGALFDVSFAGTGDFLFNASGTDNLFHNTGTLRRSATGTATFDGVPFQNDAAGVIDVTASGGVFQLNTSGSMAGGDFTVATGGVVDFNGASFTLTGSYTGSGGGNVTFTNGTLTPNNATFNFPAGFFQWANNAATIANGTLNNAATGFIQITGADPNLDHATLNNSGTITDSGARLDFLGGATLNNLSGALFDVSFAGTSDFLFNASGTDNLFHNTGTLRRSATGTATFDGVPFQNDAGAVIDVTANGGVFQLNTTAMMAGGDFTVATGGVVDFNGTSFTLTGSYTGSGGGHVNFDGGTLTPGLGGATFNFPVGFFQWANNAATIANGTLNNAATGFIQITGADPNLDHATLNNSGTITDSGARLDFLGGATLNNLSGALFDVSFAGTSDFLFNAAGTGNLFHNTGTLRRSATGTATFDGVPFQNDAAGVIDVTASGGVFQLNTSGTMAGGDFTVVTGGLVDFSGATFTLTGSYTGSGGGHVNFSNGTLTPGVGGATFDFPSGFFQWANNAATIANGTLNNTGFIQLTAGDPNLFNATLNNSGTIIDSGVRLDFLGNATLNNLSGALFDVSFTGTSDFLFNAAGTGNLFHNTGTLRRSATGTATFDGVPFQNDSVGVIDVTASGGVFQLNTSGSMAGGDFTVATGGLVDFSGATFTLTGSYTGSGGGNVNFSNGTLTPGVGGATFDFPVGFFQWANNSATIANGTLNNTGFIQLTAGDPNLFNATLNNSGTIIDSGARLDFLGGATLNNLSGALFDVSFAGSGDFMLNAAGTGNLFHNTGTLRRSATGTATFDNVPFDNTGLVETVAGTFNVNTSIAQLNGTTLTGGMWEVHDGTNINLNSATLLTNDGTLIFRGNGTITGITGSLTTNSGTIELLEGAGFGASGGFTNNGTLVIGPDSFFSTATTFAQGANGRIEFQLGGTPGSGHFGRLISTGAAALDGTAAFSFVNGYGPITGQQFTVATFPSHTGQFSHFIQPLAGRQNTLDPLLQGTQLVVTALADAADLILTNVNGDTSGTSGNNVTVNWTVTNLSSSTTFTSAWSDSVYLSLDGTLDPSDKLIGRVTHSGALVQNEFYNGTLTAPLPGLLPGSYHFIVVADSAGQMPDKDRTNNTAAAVGAITTDVTALTPGTPFVGTIKSGQDEFFRVDLPFGASPVFTFNGNVAGEAVLTERQLAIPDSTTYDARVFDPTRATQELTRFGGFASTYFLQLHGSDAAGGGQGFSFVAQGLNFTVTSIGLNHGVNAGEVTTLIHGSQFTPGTTFTLEGGQSIPASKVLFQDSGTVYATFNLTAAATGAYSVAAHQNLATSTLNSAFQVTTGLAGHFSFEVGAPRFFRPPFQTTFVTLTYANDGGTDIEAPILDISSSGGLLRAPGATSFNNQFIEVLAYNPDGPAGVLPPGAHGSILIAFQPASLTAHALSTFQVVTNGYSNTPIDWNAIQTALKPAGIATDAWNAIYTNFKASVGGTTTTLNHALAADATRLAIDGVPITGDVAKLMAFEMQKAGNFGGIEKQDYLGAFGRGLVDTFNEKVTANASGNVTIASGSQTRDFVKTLNGFVPDDSRDPAQLVKLVSGKYQLTDSDGVVSVFRSTDGLLESVAAPYGRSFTVTRDGTGRATAMVEADGDTTLFAYNAQGRISQVTDAVGRLTQYAYDGSGHVTGIVTPQGTTGFTYITGTNTAADNAIASITSPDGTHQFFTYDAAGRVIESHRDGNAQAVTFSYDGVGGTTAIDALGHTQTVERGFGGSPLREFDALGRPSNYSFANDILSGSVGVGGVATSSSLDSHGNSNSITDSAGHQTQLTHAGPFGKISTVTDPLGQTTAYNFDPVGNLSSVVLADGSQQQFTYDARGNIISSVNANGQPVSFTYDAHNLLTQKTLPDGSHVDFTYDSHRNLLAATDPNGTTSFQYDAADLVTKVTYPNGTFLAFTYDAAGRRTAVADQDGFAVHYSYDSLGRLAVVRDTNNAALVTYGYDAIGRILTEARGNGEQTNYTYDTAGHTSGITHLAANNTTLEQFTYTYDAAGRELTMTSNAGTTTYGYDGTGQLISVALPGGRHIEYSYDAVGNRTVVTDSTLGSTNYARGAVNEYSTAGGATFTYDGQGRMSTRTDSGSTTTYTYDAFGNLTGVLSPGDVFSYRYDALGNRIAATHNGVTTQFAIDPKGGGNIFGEYTQAGTAVAHYAQGLGIESRIDSTGATQFYHYDATGNTRLLTNAGGSTLNTYSYLPFGEILSQTGTTPNAFTFNGRDGVFADGDGLFNMRARSYDATLGRFTSADPVGLMGEDANLYRFVQNNPVGFSDPTGTVVVPAMVAGSATATAAYNAILATLAAGGEVLPGAGALSLGAQTIGQAAIGAGVPTPVLLNVANTVNSGVLSISQPSVGSFISTAARQGAGPLVQAVGTTAGGVLLAAGVGWGLGRAGDNLVQYAAPELHQKFVDWLGTLPGARTTPQDVLNHDTYLDQVRSPAVQTQLFKLKPNGDITSQDVHNAIELNNFTQRQNQYDQDFQLWLGDPQHHPKPVLPPLPTYVSELILPHDPNNIIGPAGPGADALLDLQSQPTRFDGFVNAANQMGYTILFENAANASAPAQTVTVTETLDSDLDLSTFQFGSFGFGNFKVDAPMGRTSWQTRIDATATLGVLVDVNAALDTTNGHLTVTFASIDPKTGDTPIDPLAGLLPPNLNGTEGEGFVTYSVKPKANTANGTHFDAQASIVFDTEAAILTPFIHNTLDTVAPDTHVNPFAASTTSRPTFKVTWAGADDLGGSGLSGINVLYTDTFNNVTGPEQVFKLTDVAGAGRFTGQVGHTYKFFSRGVDAVGNQEGDPIAPDATITVVAPTLLPVVGTRTFTDSDGDLYTIRFTSPGTCNVVLNDPDGDGKGSIDQLILSGTTAKSAVAITVRKAITGDGFVPIGDVTGTGSLSSFRALQSDLTVNGFSFTGPVASVGVRDILEPDPILAHPTVHTGGAAANLLAVTARHIGNDFTLDTTSTLSGLTAADIGTGTITAAAITRLTASAGGIGADITTAGALSALAAHGAVSGHLTASRFGTITVTGGDVSGQIDATATALALGRTAALSGLSVIGGNFTGDVRAHGQLGTFSITASKTGVGGNFTGGTVNAGGISKFTVAKNMMDDIVLAGADLGADHALGGTGANADTFGAGSLGSVTVGGNVTSSVFGAGLNPFDAIFHNGNDTILGGILSNIAAIVVAGTASNDSYFAAHGFTRLPTIHGVAVNPATDPRFLKA